MSLHSQLLAAGGLAGIIYDFDAGDELEAHAHDDGDSHITIVARGALVAFGNGWEKLVSAGNVLDWKAGQVHGFRATEPARIVNIRKGAP